MKVIIKTVKLLGFLVVATLFFGCEDNFDDHAFNTDVSVNITSFSVNGVDAEIDNQQSRITAQLPYGTNLTAITPQLTIPVGASVMPTIGSQVDFSSTLQYRVINGNIYKDYQVNVTTNKPILSFVINDLTANINHNSRMITLTMPEGTDLTQLQPVIELSEDVSISPPSETTLDFSNPVVFTVSGNGLSEDYTAVVTTPVDGPMVAFLGTAATQGTISNPDEIAASNWLFETYNGAMYLSFTDIINGAALENIDVIWWHYDSAANLPTVALDGSIISALQNYIANGGNLLLTTFASQYVEPLGIVPSGKGPNNVFGDFLPNGSIDGSDWGISFVGHEDHPVFVGLESYAPGKANLLQAGTFRLNHTAWWFLPDWGGYGDGQGWRDQTGGNNLASEAWDDGLNGRVTIAEFPGGTSDITSMIISMGAYDWYNENDTDGNNGYKDNIKILTANSLDYLVEN